MQVYICLAGQDSRAAFAVAHPVAHGRNGWRFAGAGEKLGVYHKGSGGAKARDVGQRKLITVGVFQHCFAAGGWVEVEASEAAASLASLVLTAA